MSVYEELPMDLLLIDWIMVARARLELATPAL
jgi:hypothetical protein